VPSRLSGWIRSRIPLALHERQTTARSAGRAWHGTPLASMACGLLLDTPASMRTMAAVSPLLLADLRHRLEIKLRHRAGMGDTACPLQLP
jgi:hypothetical protein